MPVISIFFGIVIRMYHKEHEPRRFHAEHRAQEGNSTSTATRSSETSRREMPST